jgi:galactose mutarotase-like enzyme
MSMKPSLTLTSLDKMKAYILENERIRVVVAADFGARVLSIIYKPTETEFVWHSPNVTLRRPEAELENVSGFFDCIPTTDPCTFRGNKLPLGGEVSSEPWRVLKTARKPGAVSVRLQGRCKIYPFVIRKEIILAKGKSVLVLKYEVHNMSSKTLEYHYSSHNTLRISPYHRFVLPHEVTKLRLGYTGRLGKIGDYVSWPETPDSKGNPVEISKIGGPCEGTMENLYTSRLKERWCAAINEAKKEAIGFSWEGDALPYLLLCTNNSGWRDYYFAAIEPCTGRPDNLEVAVNQWKDYATLKPNGRVMWSQRITLAHNIKHIEKIENDEIIEA